MNQQMNEFSFIVIGCWGKPIAVTWRKTVLKLNPDSRAYVRNKQYRKREVVVTFTSSVGNEQFINGSDGLGKMGRFNPSVGLDSKGVRFEPFL